MGDPDELLVGRTGADVLLAHVARSETATFKNEDGGLVKLSKVMFLPGAVNGLLSVDSLASKGANVEFVSATRVGLVKVEERVILSTQPGSGYVIKASFVRPVMSEEEHVQRAASTRSTMSAPLMAWHRRLGHIAPSTIPNLASKNFV